jgi:hypothetical protein
MYFIHLIKCTQWHSSSTNSVHKNVDKWLMTPHSKLSSCLPVQSSANFSYQSLYFCFWAHLLCFRKWLKIFISRGDPLSTYSFINHQTMANFPCENQTIQSERDGSTVLQTLHQSDQQQSHPRSTPWSSSLCSVCAIQTLVCNDSLSTACRGRS